MMTGQICTECRTVDGGLIQGVKGGFMYGFGLVGLCRRSSAHDKDANFTTERNVCEFRES